jgi:hypothetical protein
MIRARKLANELNIGVDTISTILGNKELIHPNYKIDVPSEKKILNVLEKARLLLHNKVNNDITDLELAIKSVIESGVDYSNNLYKYPEEFIEINEFEHETESLISAGGNYSKRKLKKLEFKNQQIKSIFTNFEVSSICLGLTDRHAKHIARKYFSKKADNTDLFELHEIAMNTYKKYGSEMIAFILALPPLPFKVKNYQNIFAELDKMAAKQSFPVMRFSFKNQDGKKEKINFTFYSNGIVDKKRKPNTDIITIKNRTTGKAIMRITRSGIVLPSQNAKNIIPILDLYYSISNNPRKAIINYGLETGECSICGRELTDKASIKRGVGPVCASYLN